MRTYLAIALFVLLAAAAVTPAHADDYEVTDVGFRFDLGDGFEQNKDLAPKIVHDFHDPTKMATLPYKAGGLVFTREKPKIAVYALWRVTDARVENIPALVRAELDDFAARPGAAKIVAATEKASDRVAQALIEYQPLKETHVLGRAVMFVDANGRMHEIRLECLFPEDELAEGRPACGKIMSTFGLVKPEVDLMSLGKVPAAPPRAASPDTSGMTLTTGGAAAQPTPAPIVVQPEPTGTATFTRLLLWGGAALVILAVGITLGYRRRRS